jgi:type IV pilus assembly protein PilW
VRTPRSHSLRGSASRRLAVGLTLVELMIGLVIGAISVVVSIEVYVRGRETYRVNERVARLQEQARVALAVIEPDVELAGYFGFSQMPGIVRLVHGGNPETVVASAAQLRQFPLHTGGATPAAVTGLPSGAHACGVNFAVDVSMPVQGSNNTFAPGRSPTACNPYQGRAQADADTLTLRRAETQASPAEANRIQIFAARHTSRSAQWMFADGVAPGPLDEHHRVHNFVVRTYYIARDSVGQRDVPALRVKSLTRSGSGVVFDEDEVMSGVEDLQVRFGIGAAGASGGRVTHYVEPGSPELLSAQVVAVRIWLRVRADQAEPAFVDGRTYRYADVVFTPSGAQRRFRRVLMMRTITLRNARSS